MGYVNLKGVQGDPFRNAREGSLTICLVLLFVCVIFLEERRRSRSERRKKERKGYEEDRCEGK